MTIKDLIRQVETKINAKLEARKAERAKVTAIRELCETEERDPTEAEAKEVRDAQAKIKELDAETKALADRRTELEAEQAADDAAHRLASEIQPGARMPEQDPKLERISEPRTYSRENDPKGVNFLRDVVRQFAFRDIGSSERLSAHMREERVERDGQLDRATGTGAFTGLVVPQYLTDLMAPHAKAGRPFADACRHHDLPEEGMTVELSKITTGSDAGIQASQNTNVTEQDMDDTQLSVAVQTNAGRQTVSRQAVERGRGIDDTTAEDLGRAYGTRLSNTLLNQATTGLTNVATSIAYTDGTPTAAELYPKLLAGPAAVEAALLDMDPGDDFAVMHSRRWYWVQSQLTSTWPILSTQNIPVQAGGVNFAEKYGSGFRGILPSGVPVVVDNNIATNLGAGTNEDEIYFAAQSEAHLWEDNNAPFLIRAEQTKVEQLSIVLVVYGYFAYTFTRRAHAQKIGGTGLITPTF